MSDQEKDKENNEELQRVLDEVRIDSALSTVKDVFYRVEEVTQGEVTVYDLMSFLAEDLIREGSCPACLLEGANRAFKETGANTDEHIQDGEAVYH